MAEDLIRQRIERYAEAIRAKDLDSVMSFFASELVSFDVEPPLRYSGSDNKRRAWQRLFATYTGPVGYEIRELSVTTHGELAFVHGLNHMSGTLSDGRTSDLWVRWTACLRRTDGVWLIAHDHVSVPADVPRGAAALDLTP